MFVNRSRRKKLDDGYWWDIYVDPVADSSQFDYIHFERPYNMNHRNPARTGNLRYLDLIELGGTLLRRIGLKHVSPPQSVSEQLELAEDELKNRFDVEIDLISLTQREMSDRAVKLFLHQQLLKRVDPKVVVLVCSYGEETLIEACQKQNVPVIELQHGVIHESHVGYSFRGSSTKEMFPDYLLVWGEYWKDAVEYPIPDDRVIPVGYPHLESSVDQYQNVATKNQLVFISQWTIGEELSKFAVEISRDETNDYEIVYKLHPQEDDWWQDEYPWLREADIEVVDSSDRPLYKLFAESRAQVGVSSTAVFEGLAFGLETFVYDCPGSEVLQILVDEGPAQFISTAEDLADSLEHGEESFNRESYFESNATENMCNILNELAETGTPH
jgi:hypothetical protein